MLRWNKRIPLVEEARCRYDAALLFYGGWLMLELQDSVSLTLHEVTDIL